MSKRRGNLAIGGLIMAGVGYLLGILTAPKSGKDTRKDIQDTAVKAKTEAEKKLKKIHAELGDLVDQGSKQVKKLSSKAKDELQRAVDKANVAKDKARDMLSAVHENESDDKDLQKAIDEASQAVNHLKNFLTKNASSK